MHVPRRVSHCPGAVLGAEATRSTALASALPCIPTCRQPGGLAEPFVRPRGASRWMICFEV